MSPHRGVFTRYSRFGGARICAYNELRIFGAELNETISREILWYIQQQHAYQFSESAVGTRHRYHQLKDTLRTGSQQANNQRSED